MRTILSWTLNHGLVITSKEEGYEIYDRYINSSHCEKCKKKYKNTLDRHMDHAHEINDKWGYFRNILCRSCNQKRANISSINTSGYKGIGKHLNKNYKLGYFWEFRANIDGKRKSIKSSINKEWLIKFAIQWKIDNNYYD